MDDADTGPGELTPGDRIRIHRRRRGMSRAVLAGLVGKSESWLKHVESGRLLPPRLPMMISVAEALKVDDLSELTGDQSMPIRMFSGPGHPALPAVRDAINQLAPLDGDPPPLEHLHARLDAAWRARHVSPDHRTVLGALLPGLIRDGQLAARTYDGDDRRRALALLAGIYNLAQFFVAYQPDASLLWRVAERSIMAAQESEDPRAIGGAVWLLAQAHRDSGDLDAAEAVGREGIEALRPAIGDRPPDDLLAMWGALLFEAAYTAARAGEQGTAWRWWDQADQVANRLPRDHYDPMTSFSQVIMGAHAVTVAVELRQGGESRRQAERAANAVIPSHPRRGRHLIEVARAHLLGNDQAAALGSLEDAYVSAPETIRYNGYARRMLLELLDGPASLRRPANDLAERVGLLV